MLLEVFCLETVDVAPNIWLRDAGSALAVVPLDDHPPTWHRMRRA